MYSIRALCPEDRRKHIDLNWSHLDSYDTLRREIVGYVENVVSPPRVSRTDAQSMVRQDGKGKNNGGGKNTGGKGGGSGFQTYQNPDKDKECHHCGRMGHVKAKCWYIDTPKDQLSKGKRQEQR